MKIVTLVRTLNEQYHIKNYCRQNDFADKILIADGGSTDKTLKLASSYPNVEIRDFNLKVPSPNGHRLLNPEAPHTNFLIDWAMEYDPDWIIFTDTDEYPTYALRFGIRKILEETDAQMVFLYRLYMWKRKHYFPDMNLPGKSLYAWRPKVVPIRAMSTDPTEVGMTVPDGDWKKLELGEPYCILHNFCPTEKKVQEKLTRYVDYGKPQLHPLQGCGRLEKLPLWANIW